MFPSIKRKISSAVINTLVTLVFLLVCYLANKVTVLHQQYQKADRLNGYLGDLEDVITETHRLQAGVEVLGKQFKVVQNAIEGSLQINLDHDNVDHGVG